MTFSTVVILASDGSERIRLAKAIREEDVYAVVLPCRTPASTILEYSPSGILIPASGDLASLDPAVLFCGGEHTVRLRTEVFGGISALPKGFRAVARSDVPTILGAEDNAHRIYGLTVHPGENPSPFFRGILRNFLFTVCRALPDYTPGALASELIARIRARVGSGRLLTALYPSVASVTANALLARALPGQVTTVCIDTGLMREHEAEELSVIFEALDLSLVRVDAGEDFLSALDGASCASGKDSTIKQTVGRVFREAARDLGHFDFFSLGRIYDDFLTLGESPSPDMISHGTEPLCTSLGIASELIPTAALFENEARALGALLGLPRKLTNRRYYPLAGVAIRINGVITREKITLLRAADRIVREELERSRSRLDKYFVALLEPPRMSDGVRLREYYSVAIVTTRTGQNGRPGFAHVPHPLLSHISDRITSELPSIKRVFFDITNDPSGFVDQIDWM